MTLDRVWQKRLSVLAWALLFALLLAPFSMRPSKAATAPHIAFISMENHGYTTIVGNSNMPFTQSLINGNGIASITDTCHPSLPNYLSITDGSIHGCPQDTLPSDATYPGPTFYDELANAGVSWKAYVDGAAGNCDINAGFGNFDSNHVPQVYYDSIRNSAAQCNRIQPLTQLGADLSASTAPSFIYIAPNLINDMHDGTDQQGDAYLNSQVSQLRNSSWFTPGSRIVIWWDEDEGTSGEQILLISVGSSHSTTIGQASHYGVLRGLEEAYGVGLLGNSALSNAPDLGAGVVGDILPLLTGAAPPPPPPPSPTPTPTPSPSPSPSPSPTPTSTPSPSPTPSASPSPSPSPSPGPVPGPSSGTRGIFRYTSTDFAAMHAAGFNASTDGGVQDNAAAQAANGIAGMVWVPAYDNTTCAQTLSNSAIAAMVQANVSAGYTGLRYEIGDEPTAFGCNAAAVYASITQAVHGADPTAKTWTADDQFQTGNPVVSGIPMKGTVDILAFDVYPCESGPCDYSAIDSAVQQIHAAGLTNWEFIIQDFSASPWRWPTPAEIQTQFDHWKNQGAIGYWVYAWDYLGAQMINQPGNVAAVQSINAQPINGSGGPTPSPSPSPSPSSSPSPSPSSSPSPSPSPPPSPPPIPPLTDSVSATPTSGTAPLTVNLTGNASGGVPPYSYAWTFGDGASSSNQSPSHTFTAAGTYSPTLVVTDSRGTQALASTGSITVRSTLVASAAGTPTFGDVPITVNFTGSAAGGAGSYTYSWAFGDGTSSTAQNPSHAYAAAGNFTATLTVRDSAGATAAASVSIAVAADPTVTLSANPPAGDAPATITFTPNLLGGTTPFTYTWDFGDGGSSRAPNPSHTYAATGTYTVLLTVIDATGHMANASVAITVNPAPQASASANVTLGDAPLAVNFAGAASSGTPTFTYSWTFGDGANVHGTQNPSHTYAAVGTYTAVFTATDAAGQSASATVVITVNAPPVASAQASTLTGSVPLSVTFTGSASSGVSPYTYSWSFGDGGASNNQNPNHVYGSAGSFLVTLTVTDATGVSRAATVGPITVSGPLAATASSIPRAGDAPVTVALYGSATGGSSPYTYLWSLGDGSSSSTQNPMHVYTSAGSYAATLTVTDAQSHSAIAQTTVDVSPALTAASSASPASGTAPLPVAFNASASGGKAPFTYTWNFGDGSSATTQNPSHTFAGPGTFSATLTIGDANGASAPAQALSVTVAPGPLVATATSNKSVGDAPVAATLSAAVSGGTPPFTYAWNLGDGSSASTGSVNHSYTTAGSFTAAVVVTDSKGVVAQSSVQLTVYPGLSVASSASPSSGVAPLQVAFAASASGGLAPYTFAWAFDDGGTASGQTASHSYGAGTFHPTLTVHDAAGGSWTGVVANVTPSAPAPAAGTANPGQGAASPGGSAGAPAAAATPTPTEASPSPSPSPSASAAPVIQPPAPAPGDSGSGSGNGPLLATVLGSIVASGVGGSLFLWWRRRRIL